MTEQGGTSGSGAGTPAGWYPDPQDAGLQRYWDGAAWTDNTYDLAASHNAPGVFRQIPAGVSVRTPWMWAIALLPVISVITVSLIDYRQYVADSMTIPTTPGAVGLPPGFGLQLLLGGVGWGVFLVSVLFAYFDWRLLTRRGVDRPFHWAWAFLSATYVIGRPIVLRRRGGSDILPSVVYLALSILGAVISLARAFDAVSYVFQSTPLG